jgi:chondroitin AC lyase
MVGFLSSILVSMTGLGAEEGALAPARAELAEITASAVDAATFDLLEKQFVDYYTAAGVNRSAPRIIDSLSSLEHSAASATAAGFLLSDGSWADINYAEIPTGQWSPWEHFRRLIVMARAYKTPGQRFYRDPAMLRHIEAALGYLPVFYGTNAVTEGNWWFWVIGPALDLGPTLVLVGDDLRPELLEGSTRILAARIGSIPGFTPTYSLLDGQNLVWSALNHYSLALLRRDGDRLGRVRDLISSMAVPQSGEEGLQRDASFQQHGPQLYTGGYGSSYGYEMSKYLLLTRGTSFTLNLSTPASTIHFGDFAVDGLAWSLFHNYFDVSVIGREVAKPWTNGYNGLATLLQMSVVPSTRQIEIARAGRKMLQTWSGGLPIELAALATTLEQGTTPAAWPSGHRHYYVSDYTVHRRPNYFASVKMLSKRTRSGEKTNDENLLGSRQSDGRFYLALRGDDYSASESWAALDWSRLPGTTVEQRPDAASSFYGAGLRSFVGGTGDGQNGVSAMDFAAIDSSLTAKKGWIFFDDSIVFFANSIRSLSGNRIETIVDQRPVNSVNATLTIDGTVRNATGSSSQTVQWIAADGIGYYFPGGERVELRREVRSGSWSALGGPRDWPMSTTPVWTLFVDHGPVVTNATTEYVIVPGVDGNGMRNWVNSNHLDVLRNDGLVSAARDRRTNSLGVIFWAAAGIEGISTDAAAVLYQVTSGSRVDLWMADPAQGSGSYHLTLPGRYRITSGDAGISAALSGRTTILTVPRSGGRTMRVTLTGIVAPRTRAARR